MCDMYPEMAKRHGHVFVPSWEYKGYGEEVVSVSMNTSVLRHRAPDELRNVVRKCLLQWVPSGLLLCAVAPGPDYEYESTMEGRFSWDNVHQVKSRLRHLTITTIDKCGQAVLIR